MNPADPNVQRVEQVAAALGDLRTELVLVGGCAASLLIDAPTAPPPRVTFDVDLIAEVAGSEPGLRAYLGAQFSGLSAMPDFRNVLPGLVAHDDLHSQRVDAVMKKILAIAVLPSP